jgi:hypothetical protein
LVEVLKTNIPSYKPFLLLHNGRQKNSQQILMENLATKSILKLFFEENLLKKAQECDSCNGQIQYFS